MKLEYDPIIKQVYILQKFCTVNRPPHPPESFVGDFIGWLWHLHNTP